MSEIQKFQKGIWVTLLFTLLLWCVKAIEIAFEIDFTHYGILPRHLNGMFGIIVGPLVHGDIYHLISNTFPLILLGIGIFYFYHTIAFEVILIVYLVTGFWVWLAAREAYHIGASGVVYGLLSFLLFSGFIRRDIKSLALSFIILLLYGGNMFYGVFPINGGVSWESHLLGTLSGLLCAFYFRKVAIEGNDENVNDLPLPHNDKVAEVVKPKVHYELKSIKKNSPTKKNQGHIYNYKVDGKDLI